MIGKGSEAIQRQHQRQQSTKRWSGMEDLIIENWIVAPSGAIKLQYDVIRWQWIESKAPATTAQIPMKQLGESNNQPNDGAAWRLGAPWSTATARQRQRLISLIIVVDP
jgi:hypothetical protein